jgi:prepilin-type N-terminal cleavage/methylation domain-containing protein
MYMHRLRNLAFTLVELLVVISIISLLTAILLPALNHSRSQAKQILCKNNLKQLVIANESYANANSGYAVPAATDIFTQNRHRWYGFREFSNLPFDTSKGPLASYLGPAVPKCPAKVAYVNISPSESQYESGSGGYGYNMIYLGSSVWIDGYDANSCIKSTRLAEVRRPSETLAFTDAAMGYQQNSYTEYAFAEPRYFVLKGEPELTRDPNPSIHFRHNTYAVVGWLDCHVDSRKLAQQHPFEPTFNLGWFAPADNTLFDLN